MFNVKISAETFVSSSRQGLSDEFEERTMEAGRDAGSRAKYSLCSSIEPSNGLRKRLSPYSCVAPGSLLQNGKSLLP
jgi:hypothetical protein